jgi:serine/threonine-protein kinase
MASDAGAGERGKQEPVTEALADDEGHGTDLFVGPVERPDEYRLVGQGARGGEGIVWRAWYRGTLPLPVEVAVKQFLAPAGEPVSDWPSPRTVDRWYEQLRLLQAVNIDHVAAYRELFAGSLPHPAGRATGDARAASHSWYLVMEWIDGPTLDTVVAAGELSLSERVRLVGEIAQAVDRLHSGASTHGMPVLHRDIKPGNIVVHPTRGAVLVDFGLLRVVEDDVMTEVPRWTGAYLAPEVHANKASASRASDVWSIAATAFFVLTGEHPSPMDPARMSAQLRTSLAGRVPDPELVITTLMRVLDASPEARPEHATVWVSELGQALTGADPSGGSKGNGSSTRRRRGIILVASIAAIVAIAGVVFAASASHGRSHKPPIAPVAKPSAYQLSASGNFTLANGRIVVSGTGTATPLGDVTLSSVSTFASYPQPAPPCTTHGTRTTGYTDFTTTTGEVVHSTFAGTACLAGVSAGGWYIFDFTGTYRFTGGSGRYRGATGSGTTHSHLEFLDNTGGSFTVASIGTFQSPPGLH